MYKLTFTNDLYDLNGTSCEVDLKCLPYLESDDKYSACLLNGWTFNGRNITENRIQLNVLCLDVDDNITIEDFQERFAQYEYYLYSTWSHTPEKHKFRVFLPLKKPILAIDMQYIKKRLLKLFSGIDESCLQSNHRFFVNNKKPGAEHVKIINEGSLLEAYDYYMKPSKRMMARKKSLRKPVYTGEKSIKGLETYISKIKFEDGAKHETLVKLIYKFKDDYDLDTICDVVESLNNFNIKRYLLRNI